jgi:D-Tyr-tRNA(Tyr) deacylase
VVNLFALEPAGAAETLGRFDLQAHATTRKLASMRAVIQRVSRAQVLANGEVIGKIGRGILVLLAVGGPIPAPTPTTSRRKSPAFAFLKMRMEK